MKNARFTIMFIIFGALFIASFIGLLSEPIDPNYNVSYYVVVKILSFFTLLVASKALAVMLKMLRIL